MAGAGLLARARTQDTAADKACQLESSSWKIPRANKAHRKLSSQEGRGVAAAVEAAHRP